MGKPNDLYPPKDGDENKHKAIREARSWWAKNGFYLSAQARKAFLDSILAVSRHKSLADEGRGTGDKGQAEEVKKNFETTKKAGKIIADGAGADVSDEVLSTLRKIQAPSDG